MSSFRCTSGLHRLAILKVFVLSQATHPHLILLVRNEELFALLFPALCGESEWRCEGGACIPKDQRCDGFPHCQDGTDELDCPALPILAGRSWTAPPSPSQQVGVGLPRPPHPSRQELDCPALPILAGIGAGLLSPPHPSRLDCSTSYFRDKICTAPPFPSWRWELYCCPFLPTLADWNYRPSISWQVEARLPPP